MKNRIIAALIVSALLVSLSGCTTLFKKEYLSVSKYRDNAQSASNSDVAQISDYTELKEAVISLVNSHKTEGRLRFSGYEGTIQSDLSQALWEVKAESALASYAVDYMSYDLSRIVTYYEAVVYITYKRTQSEIDDIRYISGKAELTEVLEPVVEEMDSYIALRITSSTITADEVAGVVNDVYAANPAACVVPPNVSVKMHPEDGLQRIIEIELEYGWKLSELQKMKSVLNEKISKLVENVSDVKAAVRALDIFEQLAQICAYDPSGTLRSSRSELDSGLGSTAYGALVEGYADSKGIAAAYSALCYAAGINCTLVDGIKDGEDHCWNIIEIDGSYYHVDASAYYASGLSRSFMQNDEQMKENCNWDTDKYPSCNGAQAYSDIIKKVF